MIITGGKHKGTKVLAPDAKITRPTLSKLRESVFSMLYSVIDFEGKIFLDMFAGSGIIGLEALSRGFEEVYSFEKNPKVASILKQNYQKIGANSNLVVGDSLKNVIKLPKKADVIYIDPPYQSGIYESCLNIVKNVLATDGIIVLEHSKVLDFSGFNVIKQKKYGDKFITFLN